MSFLYRLLSPVKFGHGLSHTSLEMASSFSSSQPKIQELLVLNISFFLLQGYVYILSSGLSQTYIYLTCLMGQRWRFRALPMPSTHLDFTPASAPSPIAISKDPGDLHRFCELLDELSRLLAPNCEFEGWWVHMSLSFVSRSFSKDLTRVFVFAPDHREIHLLEKPVVVKGYYHSKVIITRTMSAI